MINGRKIRRRVGVLEDGIFTKFEKESDVYRKRNAWTYQISWGLAGVFTLVYKTSHATYTISVEKALRVGTTEVLGGEPKLLIPKCHWSVIKHD